MAVSLFRIRQLLIILVITLSIFYLFNAAWTYNNSDLDYSKWELNRRQVKDKRKETQRKSAEDVVKHLKYEDINIDVINSDSHNVANRAASSNSNSAPYSFSQTKCNIPKLSMDSPEVSHFFKPAAPLTCHRKLPNWVYLDDDGKVVFHDKRKSADCQISYIHREDDATNAYDPFEQLKDGDIMKHDFAKVFCKYKSLNWTSLLMTVAKNEHLPLQTSSFGTSTPMDVYFLGFDSLSQMSFRRKLKKTVNVLENLIGSTILNGYNIVGDGTPQAFIPILTAQTEVELPLTRRRFKDAHYVDDVYPFIWKNFSDAGYVTAYGEDAFNIGTFTYRLKGFRKQPTDHYIRTFFKDVEELIGYGVKCIGSIPLHKMWLSYARNFMRTYKNASRFLIMHQSILSHDDINSVEVEDDDLANHLKQMHDEGLFDNALVIVMADHGHRFAKLRETQQGQLEERLPFFSLSLPKKFRNTEIGKAMQKNLEDNRNKLTTPFDIHATLLDILHHPSLSQLTAIQDSFTRRSLSLFRPMPDNRTCSQAGVEAHWCTCLDWQDALKDENDSQISNQLARLVVRVINEQLANVSHLCAPLLLDHLKEAKKLVPNNGVLHYKNVKDADGFIPDLSGQTKATFAHFQLKLQTKPGNAIYEVTLFYDFVLNKASVDLNSISHVNKYGDAPHCIIDENYFLATYCVCYDKVNDR